MKRSAEKAKAEKAAQNATHGSASQSGDPHVKEEPEKK